MMARVRIKIFQAVRRAPRRLTRTWLPARARHPWGILAFDTVKLGLEAQHVIALRLTKIMSGHRDSRAEIERMISEKPPAFVKAQTEIARALACGSKDHVAARQALRILEKVVRANRRRLTRG
jgi:hypothetical protein